MLNRLQTLGFTSEEAYSLRRIAMALQRWAELECGTDNGHASYSIERDETTGKPFMCVYPHRDSKCHRTAIADREAGALRRLAKIMAAHPELVSYHQTDPRGAALYILRRSDVRDGERIDSIYPRGVAVYK